MHVSSVNNSFTSVVVPVKHSCTGRRPSQLITALTGHSRHSAATLQMCVFSTPLECRDGNDRDVSADESVSVCVCVLQKFLKIIKTNWIDIRAEIVAYQSHNKKKTEGSIKHYGFGPLLLLLLLILLAFSAKECNDNHLWTGYKLAFRAVKQACRKISMWHHNILRG